MASVNGFTTVAKVKSRIKNFNSEITTGEVEEYINHAEGMVIAVTRTEWKGTIPLMVEAATTDIAALYLLANDPSGFSSITESAFIADVLWASAKRYLIFLEDDRIKKFIKGADN